MKTTKGFTVIEVLIALAIMSLTLSIGFSGLQSFLTKQRVNTYAGTLLQTVHTARQQAILSGKRVTVCASADGKTCQEDWTQGHLIFVDSNGDRSLDNDDRILNHVYGNAGRDVVRWKSFKTADTLQFLPTGITNHQNGTFIVCGNGANGYARGVIITKMGRPRMSKDENGDGIDEGANGKPLSC